MMYVVIPYSVDQNCPSRPFSKLFDMPCGDYKSAMRELWKGYFNADPNDDWMAENNISDDQIVVEAASDAFGDLVVSFGDMSLFFTAVEGYERSA